jgi:hypothetical protein
MTLLDDLDANLQGGRKGSQYLRLRAVALALRALRLRAVALALRALRLRAKLDVSRYRAHAPRALALRVQLPPYRGYLRS